MAAERSIYKITVTPVIKYETFVKIRKIYAKKDESVASYMERVLEESVKGVKLNVEELKEVAAYTEDQYRKRMAKREADAKKNGTVLRGVRKAKKK